MISSNTDNIADFQIYFTSCSIPLVLLKRHLVVCVLSSVVVDVVERVKPTRSVRVQRLHDLISCPTNLSEQRNM